MLSIDEGRGQVRFHIPRPDGDFWGIVVSAEQIDKDMGLSRNRAVAVVAALIAQHGIAKDRLSADGVGPLALVSSNTGEAGRAKNRRVEMVLR